MQKLAVSLENKNTTTKIFLDRGLMCDVSDIYNQITIYQLTMAGIFFYPAQTECDTIYLLEISK